MNGTDDFIGRLEEYLDDFDGATPLPDHVRDAIHAELPGTRQVHAVAGPRRVLTMLSTTSARARWGLAAAAIVVAVVVGGAIIVGNRNQQGGIAAPANPTPTIAPTPTPTPTASPVLGLLNASMVPCPVRPAVTCMAPGTYKLSSPTHWPTTISFDVPEGWWEWFPGNDLQDYEGFFADSPAEGGSGWGPMVMTVGEVSRDPCDPNAPMFKPADVDTPAELAAAMATWPGFEATTPEPISIDGVEGLMVELTSTKTFKQCPDGQAFIWKTEAGALVDTYPMVDADGLLRPAQFRIVDVDGHLIVVRTPDLPVPSPYEVSQGLDAETPIHAADLVEMQAILDSIRFGDPRP
jgi:hypothetical protein